MRRNAIRTISLTLVLVMCCVSFCNAENYDKVSRETALSVKKLSEECSNPSVSSVGGEWAVIALSRSGKCSDKTVFENYLKNLKAKLLENDGVLHTRKYTEYARAVLALSALGEDPTAFCGYDLVAPLADFEKVSAQGLNGMIWALIALDSKLYSIPENGTATREKYVDEILLRALPEGGWSLDGKSPAEADITAMALTALSSYRENAEVSAAVEKAVSVLSALQCESGVFMSGGEETCESTAQVLLGLTSLGISPEDARFVKNGKTVVDALFTFHLGDGSFCHTADKKEPSQMSGEQALYALVAYERSLDGKTALFDMSDVVRCNPKLVEALCRFLEVYERYIAKRENSL